MIPANDGQLRILHWPLRRQPYTVWIGATCQGFATTLEECGRRLPSNRAYHPASLEAFVKWGNECPDCGQVDSHRAYCDLGYGE